MKLLHVISIFAAAALLCAQSDTALEKAIRKETLEGDLKGAIESYKKLAQDKNRVVASKALVHLGECYEKLGDAEARKAYERVEREFADQKEEAAAAHVRLAALGKTTGSGGSVVRMIDGYSKNQLAGASPDGRYLLEWSSEGLIRRDLAAGRTQIVFKEDADNAIVSPDSSKIALTLWRQSMSEIWTMAADGGQRRKLWQGESGWRARASGWMPDGKRIVVRLQQGTTLARLITVSTEDGSATKIWEAATYAGGVGPLSPDGAYELLEMGKYDRNNPQKFDPFTLTLVSTTDLRETPILAEFGWIWWPQWAPDGKGLVFLSNRRATGNSMDLWYLAIAGGKAQGRPQLIQSNLTQATLAPITREGTLYYQHSVEMREVLIAEIDPATGKAIGAPQPLPGQTEGSSGQPIYSPDGRWIMYRGSAPESSIHILRDLHIGEEKKLQTGFVGATEQMWFPDSRSVLVNSFRHPENARGFYRMDAMTGSATLLKAGSFGASFAISPNGKTVYYSQYDPSQGQTRVMAWEIGGSEREVMRGQGYPDVGTHWIGIALSPDGGQLATRRTEGQDSVIDIRPSSGGEKRELYRAHTPQVIHEVQWAPDGRYLIFSVIQGERESLWRVPASGGTAQELGISARTMGKIVFHPDGRHIAFVSAEGGAQIMALDHFLPAAKN